MGTAERGERGARTLADKLAFVRELKTPKGKTPPSYKTMAAAITEKTGVTISHSYLWELFTGATTNPDLDRLRAIAQWAKVPLAYLTGDEGTAQLESQMELLSRLKRAGVRDIKLNDVADTASADPETVLHQLLDRLQLLEAMGDEKVLDAAVQISSLPQERRQILNQLTKDPAVLDALGESGVQEIARSAAGLSPASQQAVLTMITQLRNVERGNAK